MASSTVTTFATLFGKTKAQVIAENLLDDGNFDPTGYVSGTLTKYNGEAPTSGNYGTSLDQPNPTMPAAMIQLTIIAFPASALMWVRRR